MASRSTKQWAVTRASTASRTTGRRAARTATPSSRHAVVDGVEKGRRTALPDVPQPSARRLVRALPLRVLFRPQSILLDDFPSRRLRLRGRLQRADPQFQRGLSTLRFQQFRVLLVVALLELIFLPPKVLENFSLALRVASDVVQILTRLRPQSLLPF